MDPFALNRHLSRMRLRVYAIFVKENRMFGTTEA